MCVCVCEVCGVCVIVYNVYVCVPFTTQRRQIKVIFTLNATDCHVRSMYIIYATASAEIHFVKRQLVFHG